MMLKQDLTRRGVLIVGLPLMCQIVLVMTMSILLWQLQAQLLALSESRQFILQVRSFTNDFVKSVFEVNLSLRTTLDTDRTAVPIGEVGNKVDGILQAATTKYEAETVQLDRLKESGKTIQRLTEWSKSEIENGALRQGNRVFIKRIFGSTITFLDCLNGFIVIEEAKRAGASDRIEMMHRAIIFALYAGGAASIALAALLGYLYSTGIRRPLAQIAENGHRISKRLPLPPALTGEDEFSKLDRLLHAVSTDIENAAAREKSMLDNAADLICSLDGHGNFQMANPFVVRMLGYEHDQIVGKPLKELVLPEDAQTAENLIRSATDSDQQSVFELRMVKFDHSVIDTRWSCFWSAIENSLFCVVHDITEQKRIERLKEDFTNMISHDLRTPLMSTLSSMTLIRKGVKGAISREVEKEITIAERNIDRLIFFVNDLLDFQKLRAGKMTLDLEACSINDAIDEAVELLQGNAEAKSISIRVPNQNWSLACDRQKLVQTLVNLLSNAISHSPQGSSIVLAVQDQPHHLEISVTDEGAGVPEEFREKIFDAFEQLPTSSTGTGLGLAICRLIVEAHGGMIGVRDGGASSSEGGESTPDKTSGSTFWFRLPKSSQA